MLVKNAGREAAQPEGMFFVIKRIAALAGQSQIFFQMHGRHQRGVGIGVQPFTVQQPRYLLFAQLREKRFPCARGVHRQLAANRCGHAHQLRTLHLVDNNRLVIALIQYGQVYRLAGLLHQLAQNRVDNRQQVAALQEAAADNKRMRPHRPVSQLAHLTHESQLLHGGQQTVRGGVRQASLLRQLRQGHAAVRFGYPFQQLQAARQGLNLSARLCSGGCSRFSAAFSGNGRNHDELLFLYRGNHFRFIWWFCNRFPD